MCGNLDADVKSLVPGPVNVDAASSVGTPFTAVVKNQIYLKYQSQCSHINECGERCPQGRHE